MRWSPVPCRFVTCEREHPNPKRDLFFEFKTKAGRSEGMSLAHQNSKGQSADPRGSGP